MPAAQTEAADDANTAAESRTAHGATVFVRHLPSTATSEQLAEFFSQIAPVRHAVAVRDTASQECRGYGFVSYAFAADAERAILELKRVKFSGSSSGSNSERARSLRLELAKRRQRKGGRDAEHAAENDAPAKATAAAAAAEVPRLLPRPRLIVRNLPWCIRTGDDLAKYFRPYGKVVKVIIPRKKGGLMAGFGFVEMKTRKAAARAVECVNGKEVSGRKVAVDWTLAKDEWQKTKDDSSEDDQEDDDKQDGPDEQDEHADEVDCGDESDLHSNGQLSSGDDHEFVTDGNNKTIEKAQVSKGNTDKTIFIRNLPYEATEIELRELLSQFGDLSYALIVVDPDANRSRGTAFARFKRETDFLQCLQEASKIRAQGETSSILVESSVEGLAAQFTLHGRVLNITKAVNRREAEVLQTENADKRQQSRGRNIDRRNIFLLEEGHVKEGSAIHSLLSPMEVTIRQDSLIQRKKLLQSNPALHLSLTRLSVRNLPRAITSKLLKALSRHAIVQFASEVKSEKRAPLSHEEIGRMKDLRNGKGVVTQAKIITEDKFNKQGRSRGYGFVEFRSHKWALMALRWMNARNIGLSDIPDTKVDESEGERRRRLLVEFAIENVNVVKRRKEREHNARERAKKQRLGDVEEAMSKDPIE